MDWILEKVLLYSRRSLIVAAVLVVIGSTFAWWHVVWQSPVRVFDDMLANNLSATSVTKLIKANSSSGSSVDQTVRLQMGSANATDWLVMARQTGATVATESIGTPTTGYIRYTRIVTGQQSAGTFAKVVNVWGKSDGRTDTSLGALFSQTLLDINNAPPPPIANLPSEPRANLLDYMHREQVFTPNYKTVKYETVDGRWAYIYSVQVHLGVYVRMMQAFAHDLALNGLDNIDPNQYQNIAPLDVTMAVDATSHQLLKISFPTSGFVQSYTDWGLLAPIVMPAHTISTTDLQTRLQSLTARAR